MKWFKKAQIQEDRSKISINNMKVLRNTVGAGVEAEWEDAEDFRRQHYTRETGFYIGEVSGEIELSGKVYLFLEDGDSPAVHLKQVIEEDPPESIVKIVEDATHPVSWDDVKPDPDDVKPKVTAEVTRLDPIDVGLYDAVVRVLISGSYRFNPADY